jgi:hypothetical protein
MAAALPPALMRDRMAPDRVEKTRFCGAISVKGLRAKEIVRITDYSGNTAK